MEQCLTGHNLFSFLSLLFFSSSFPLKSPPLKTKNVTRTHHQVSLHYSHWILTQWKQSLPRLEYLLHLPLTTIHVFIQWLQTNCTEYSFFSKFTLPWLLLNASPFHRWARAWTPTSMPPKRPWLRACWTWPSSLPTPRSSSTCSAWGRSTSSIPSCSSSSSPPSSCRWVTVE